MVAVAGRKNVTGAMIMTVIYAWFTQYLATTARVAERKEQLAGTMSGGEQAMLSIGRVLTGNSKLMLLDEPSEGVQPNIVTAIGDIIIRINKELNLTVLIVEQHIGLIQQVSQRGYAMDKGTIIDSMTGKELQDYDRIKSYLSV